MLRRSKCSNGADMCHPQGTMSSLIVGQAGVFAWKFLDGTPPVNSIPPLAIFLWSSALHALFLLHYPIMQKLCQFRTLPSMKPWCQLCPAMLSRKPRCNSLSPPTFSSLLSLYFICVMHFMSGHPKLPFFNSPIFLTIFFNRLLRSQLVAGSGEVQNIHFCKRPHVTLTIWRQTIWKRVGIVEEWHILWANQQTWL